MINCEAIHHFLNGTLYVTVYGSNRLMCLHKKCFSTFIKHNLGTRWGFRGDQPLFIRQIHAKHLSVPKQTL